MRTRSGTEDNASIYFRCCGTERYTDSSAVTNRFEDCVEGEGCTEVWTWILYLFDWSSGLIEGLGAGQSSTLQIVHPELGKLWPKAQEDLSCPWSIPLP